MIDLIYYLSLKMFNLLPSSTKSKVKKLLRVTFTTEYNKKQVSEH